MNNNKNILTIENYNNNIKLGQYFIFSIIMTRKNTIYLSNSKSKYNIFYKKVLILLF